MNIRKLLSLILLVSSISAFGQYSEDILGNPFLRREVKLTDDYEGKVVATLVKCDVPKQSTVAMLYVHGYNDYFFQKEFALEMSKHSLNFYALDLRKYGRSRLPHQKHFNVRNLNEYFVEIDSCVSIIKQEGNKEIFIVGHSTGGLITSLYMNQPKRDSSIVGLILNSPFLSMNSSWFNEKIGIPFVSILASIIPNSLINDSSSDAYAQSLLKKEKGEWQYDTTLKFRIAPKKTFSWIKAIHSGHKKIKKGLGIHIPVLVMHSDKTCTTNYYTEYTQKSDAVLDHREIQSLAPNLGQKVSSITVVDGLHDLALSSPHVRQYYYNVLISWIELHNRK